MAILLNGEVARGNWAGNSRRIQGEWPCVWPSKNILFVSSSLFAKIAEALTPNASALVLSPPAQLLQKEKTE